MKLKTLEAEHPECIIESSPTQVVGAPVSNIETRVKHQVPMLSLANAFQKEDLEQFEKRVLKNLNEENVSYVAELKYDGVAVSFRYKDGQFVQAITRGDGHFGEDVTDNVKRFIKDFPRTLDTKGLFPHISEVEVRGEAILKKSEFETYNNQQVYSTARNLVSGVLSRKHNNNLPLNVDFKPYTLLLNGQSMLEPFGISTQYEVLNVLKKLGFSVDVSQFQSLPDMKMFTQSLEERISQREQYLYNIDGFVLKVDSLSRQLKLGATSHSPKWAIAYKFGSKRVVSIIRNVEFSVGRTGKISPVAHLDPVKIGGVEISRVSLYNKSFVDKMNIMIGSSVLIERSGDVIPKVVDAFNAENDLIPIDWSTCKCGKSSILVHVGQKGLMCSNPECLFKVIKKIEHFASTLRMEGLGPKNIRTLVEYQYISDVADLFLLENVASQLKLKDGWGEKKVKKLLLNIQHAKERCSLGEVLHAFGIPNVGKETALALADRFGTIDALLKAKEEDILSMEDIGSVTATSLINYFKDPIVCKTLEKIEKSGILNKNHVKGSP